MDRPKDGDPEVGSGEQLPSASPEDQGSGPSSEIGLDSPQDFKSKSEADRLEIEKGVQTPQGRTQIPDGSRPLQSIDDREQEAQSNWRTQKRTWFALYVGIVYAFVLWCSFDLAYLFATSRATLPSSIGPYLAFAALMAPLFIAGSRIGGFLFGSKNLDSDKGSSDSDIAAEDLARHAVDKAVDKLASGLKSLLDRFLPPRG